MTTPDSLEKLLARGVDNALLRFGLGQACQRLGMLEEARQAWHNGLEVARKRGDKQTEKEMTVFLRRLEKAARAPEA